MFKWINCEVLPGMFSNMQMPVNQLSD